ncbi:MAG: ammonium transporter [Eubacterium sp.]|nr:ammonium transporter [Eubacterium sp.]
MAYVSVDVMWTLLGAAMVFFMQAGFSLCEAGLTRAKNTGNILMKNLMDFCIGTPAFWLVGFGLMFGGTGAFVGRFDPFILGDYDFGSIPKWCYVIFQTVFCATAATIVSGSMAERTKFSSYCVYSALISLLVYPISGHWIWGGGWLSELGFHDFAGSCAVHMVGGVAACIGAATLGPRIGKYSKDGTPRAIPGHNLTAVALGVFILWFCWFGFNGCSTVSMSSEEAMLSASLIFMNTNLAAAVATCVVLVVTWILYKKPDVSMCLNGALAGLVAITAGCDVVDPFGAFFIGLAAGGLVVASVEFFDKVAKIDDPVGAISVHGACGMFGTLAVGLFATDGGVFYGGGFGMLGTQALGVLAVAAWAAAMMAVIFQVIKRTIGLRVEQEIEIDGLDLHEHGLASAYSGFAVHDVMGTLDVNENTDLGEDDPQKATEAQMNAAVSVVRQDGASAQAQDMRIPDTGMYKVAIIAKLSRFEKLKRALNELGVTGMTVTQVMGCGIQRGAGEYYRGVEMDATLLPKIKIEVVVNKIPVDQVIETAKKVLYSGRIGDGKIFVFHVARVVKVRTGEEDGRALQDVE